MAQTKPSYLIVGAGVFGVSTAYHLITKYPDAIVTLVDRDAFDADDRVAASWDWNKVMRADYDDLTYCELALEAQDVFKRDPLWKPYFHETGIYWMCGRTYAQACMTNFEKLGRGDDISAWSVEEARKLYGGLFANADYRDVEQVLINKRSGWVAAGDCLLAVTREAIRRGVNYLTADVACLEFDRLGNCAGVVSKTGKVTRADHVILCTGAFTPKLLELSAARSGNDKLQAGPRILAGGITTGMTTLDDETFTRFAAMPVGVQGYTARAST